MRGRHYWNQRRQRPVEILGVRIVYALGVARGKPVVRVDARRSAACSGDGIAAPAS